MTQFLRYYTGYKKCKEYNFIVKDNESKFRTKFCFDKRDCSKFYENKSYFTVFLTCYSIARGSFHL